MNQHLKHELESEQNLLKRYRNRMQRLESLRFQKAPRALLQQQYDKLIIQLNRQYTDAITRTAAERTVFEKIKRATNIVFYPSVWIVNRNVDLFCPAIGALHRPILKGQKVDRVPIMRGFVIEVDGSIHDRELKMKKDTSKYRLINALGIGLTVLHNEAVHDVGVNDLIKQLMQLPRLDSRARRRLWRKIYNATLAYHASDEVMVSLYGPQFLDSTAKGVA